MKCSEPPCEVVRNNDRYMLPNMWLPNTTIRYYYDRSCVRCWRCSAATTPPPQLGLNTRFILKNNHVVLAGSRRSGDNSGGGGDTLFVCDDATAEIFFGNLAGIWNTKHCLT